MAALDASTYRFMNGWDLIAGTKQKIVNRELQKTPDIPISVTKKIDYLGSQVNGKIEVLFRAPSIYVKDISGRQVDVLFPIAGTITIGNTKIVIPTPQSLVATVQLTQIEAETQDETDMKKTKCDLILDLKCKDIKVDFMYESESAQDYAFSIIALKKVLREEVAKRQQYKIVSFYRNDDPKMKYKSFTPHLADFSFVRDESNVDNSNVLVLMLTKHQKRGSVFFNAPILPDNEDYILMVNNHLFLLEIIYPNLVTEIKTNAKQKGDVTKSLVISANDATNESWTIHNTHNIELDKERDPWISKLECKVDETVDQLMLYMDIKAEVTFVAIHLDTWERVWLKMQNDAGKIAVVKTREENDRSTKVEWWKRLIAYTSAWVTDIIHGLTDGIVNAYVPNLDGKFDYVAKTIVQWPSQKNVAIKNVLTPGHIVFGLDVKV